MLISILCLCIPVFEMRFMLGIHLYLMLHSYSEILVIFVEIACSEFILSLVLCSWQFVTFCVSSKVISRTDPKLDALGVISRTDPKNWQYTLKLNFLTPFPSDFFLKRVLPFYKTQNQPHMQDPISMPYCSLYLNISVNGYLREPSLVGKVIIQPKAWLEMVTLVVSSCIPGNY